VGKINPKNKRFQENRAKVDDRQLKILLEAGWTDQEIAKFFAVGYRSIKRWKAEVPAFKKLVDKYRRPSNARVERSLYERANGYIIREEKTTTDAKGNETKIETIKELPPDPASMIFWLKNRERTRWRDRVDLGGEDLKITVSRKEYTKEEPEKSK
jgi:hypothetical protein